MSQASRGVGPQSQDWWTPQVVIDLIGRVWPGKPFVDLCGDVESSARLGASWHHSKEDPWDLEHYDRAFCNPPGGKARLTQKMWVECVSGWTVNQLGEVLWLSFTLDTLQTSQGKGVPSVTAFPTWIPAKRLPYYSPELKRELPGAHPSAITLLTDDALRASEFFAACMSLIPGVGITPENLR